MPKLDSDRWSTYGALVLALCGLVGLAHTLVADAEGEGPIIVPLDVDGQQRFYSCTEIPRPVPVSADIGDVGAAGSVGVNGDKVLVRGSGADIWGKADAFHFVHVPVTGDFQAVVRVDSITPTDPWAKAGIMVRESTDPAARHALVFQSSSKGTAFHYRTSPGGNSAGGSGNYNRGPYWLRLTREGNTITGEISADGQNWKEQGKVELALPAEVLVGLALTSHAKGKVAEAVFAEASLNGILIFEGLPRPPVPPPPATGPVALGEPAYVGLYCVGRCQTADPEVVPVNQIAETVPGEPCGPHSTGDWYHMPQLITEKGIVPVARCKVTP